MTHHDMIVIGSGPAGRRAAVQAAKLGKRVLVVEDRARVGGVSVHTGTIPSKTLRETVLNLSGWRERAPPWISNSMLLGGLAFPLP